MTPGWVRRHRQRERALTQAVRTELHLQALTRVEQEDAEEELRTWQPRRGMSFASEG